MTSTSVSFQMIMTCLYKYCWPTFAMEDIIYLPWQYYCCHITMEATYKEQKSADNCSPPQGYRLSTIIADHALSGCIYLTYMQHLSQLSMKVNARCNLHRRLAETKWGARFDVPQTSTTGFATCSVAYRTILNQTQGEEDCGSVVGIGKN